MIKYLALIGGSVAVGVTVTALNLGLIYIGLVGASMIIAPSINLLRSI